MRLNMKLREKDVEALMKGYVKQNWTKINLFNLSRQPATFSKQSSTYFQQKWAAKRVTRKYHGEHLTKRQWQNMFKHSLKSAVPMNLRRLASSDGSEMAAGRGSGLEQEGKQKPEMSTPYMLQTFAPQERRLDIAIFRAMFASSSLQARQFVIHGFVKVNGKLMKYPNYMLNPGDMFSVDLDKVLYATGAPKQIPKSRKSSASGEAAEEAGEAEEAAEAPAEAKESKAGVEEAAEAKKETSEIANGEEAAEAEAQEEAEETRKAKSEKRPSGETAYSWQKDPNYPKEFDITKQYRTPWLPRDHLSPWAFIPSYLEVNHNIGHAVYLRDPVVKPGLSEIPSPFNEETMQLSYNWFLRRR